MDASSHLSMLKLKEIQWKKTITKTTIVLVTGLISVSVITSCSESNTQETASRPREPQNIVISNKTPTSGGVDMAQWPTSPEIIIDSEKSYSALIKTNKGDITVELFQKETPVTVNNFVFLSREGFYNGVKFHRVLSGFMIQTGDPTGTGRGGPGYRFDDELVTRDYSRGTLAMANSGPNTNGSQFFIMHNDYPLPKNYIIFGNTIDGFDTIDTIANSPVTASTNGEKSTPLEELIINEIIITEH